MLSPRLSSIAGGTALVALLSACASRPVTPVAVSVPPPVVVSTPAPTVVTPPATVATPAAAPIAAVEYGRVANIESFAGGTTRGAPNVGGAILGGVAGAALGNQVGSGSGRTAATVLGGAAGAAAGSQVGRTATTTEPAYRVTIQTDDGAMRYYDVPGTGDLRVGDRVRVENGVIYRA
jgi:outer membrane lipoprotein SlyB